MPTRIEFLRHVWRDAINSYLREDALDNMISASERSAAYEAVFATLYALDDPGIDAADSLALYEDLLGADPSGMEGRPGSADALESRSPDMTGP